MIASLFMLVLVNLRRGRKEEAATFYQELHKVVLALDENWAVGYDKWAQASPQKPRGRSRPAYRSLRSLLSAGKRSRDRTSWRGSTGTWLGCRKKQDARLKLRKV